MGKICIIIGCKSTYKDKVGFFCFPKDPDIASKWLEMLKNGLKKEFVLREKDDRKVCGRHFKDTLIRETGRGKRLMFGAVPNLIELPPPPLSNGGSKITRHSNPIRQTPALIISSLQGKVQRLEDKVRKLKSDPPSSLIINHRHKLRQFMDRDAYIMFDSAIKNHGRSSSGHRHSLESKELTSRLFHKSQKAYCFIKPIFSLPSIRTIDRHDGDCFTETGVSHETRELL